MVFSGRKNRRRRKRREVQWEGELKAKISGVEEIIKVRIVNFSATGALLHSDRIYAGPYHLALPDNDPDLSLSIFTQDGTLESHFKIRWYDRSVELDTFQIGIEFLDMLENNRELIDKIVARF